MPEATAPGRSHLWRLSLEKAGLQYPEVPGGPDHRVMSLPNGATSSVHGVGT